MSDTCMCVCVSAAAMEELLCELRLFLDLLDREYLSAGVRERKMQLSNILHRVLSERGEVPECCMFNQTTEGRTSPPSGRKLLALVQDRRTSQFGDISPHSDSLMRGDTSPN